MILNELGRLYLAVRQVGELLAADVVDLYRIGNVAGVVEQDVLVGLDDGKPWPAQVSRQPVSSDQAFGMGIRLQGGSGIGRQQYTPSLPRGRTKQHTLLRGNVSSTLVVATSRAKELEKRWLSQQITTSE